MEISQILEVTTDNLLFGSTKGDGGRFRKYFENKTEKQIEFLCRLLEAAGDNLDLM